MNRRNLIKNSLMALAVSFLPKILQPSVPEVSDEYEYFLEVPLARTGFMEMAKGNVIVYDPDEYRFLKFHPQNKDNAL